MYFLRCFVYTDGSTEAGTPLVLAENTGATYQKWHVNDNKVIVNNLQDGKRDITFRYNEDGLSY